jgi:hypothetical protein
MKMRINRYFCTNERCNWTGSQRPGGTTVIYKENGEMDVENRDYGCPRCGSELEFKSYIGDVNLYNSCQPVTR